MTLRAGIHDEIPAEIYHADPAPEPSLSAGIAHRLISRSPLHAWYEHPRLNPAHEREEKDILDFGTAAHSLLLQGLDVCEVIDAPDWRTKAARTARDSARKSGLIPLLSKDWDRMSALCAAVKTQTARHHARPLPLRDGKPEQTLIWREENGVWCRARIDYLIGDDVIDDLKTTGTSANPHEWARNRLFADGKDIQHSFYLRGLKALTGLDGQWRFVVVEVKPPFGMSVISLAPTAVELAEQKVERAIELWKRCIDSGEWPGYEQDVAFAELPAWEEARFLETHYEELAA